MMGVLARYFGRQYAIAIGVVGGLLLSIVFLLDLAELFRRTATKESASIHIVFSMGLAKLPQTLEVVLPFVVLFAAIFALWRSARRQEIVIARAAGQSIWRIVAPLLLVAVALGLFNLTIFNPIAARLENVYDRLVLKYISEGSTLDLSSGGLWLRQPLEQDGKKGVAVIHATKVQGTTPLTLTGDVMLLFFDHDEVYRGRMDATGGVLGDGEWQFGQATLRMAGVDKPQVMPDYRVPTTLTPARIEDSLAQPDELSFWQLPGFIHALDATGFSSVRHRTHYQALLAQPVLLLAMVLIAVVFMQRQLRNAQGLLLLAGAVGAGTAIFILNNTVLAFGNAGTLPPFLAAWTLPLATCALAFGLLLHLEEGG